MGVFKNKGKGRLASFVKGLKGTGTVKKLVGGAIEGLASFIPGGSAVVGIAKKIISTPVFEKMKNAVKSKMQNIDLAKIKDTLLKENGSASDEDIMTMAKALQEETGQPIETRQANANTPTVSANELAVDSTVLTTTGDNSEVKPNNKKGMLENLKEKWNGLETWQKYAIGIGAPVLIIVALGYTLFAGTRKGKKFFGKLRK